MSVQRAEFNFMAAGVAISLTASAVLLNNSFFFWAFIASLWMVVLSVRSCDRNTLLLACLFPGSMIVAGISNSIIASLTTRTMDAQLLSIDFGVALSMMNWTAQHPVAHRILSVGYDSLPFVTGLAIVHNRRIVKPLALSILFVVPCYFLFPAVGPAHVSELHAFRNCFPSIHLTWALLIYVYASPKLRIPAILFVLLTAAATLGMGEHYVVDLVAALPFTCAVCYAARWLLSPYDGHSERDLSALRLRAIR